MNKVKKIFIAAILTIFAAALTAGLAACQKPHEHSFGEWEDLVNTCTEHVQSRTCDDCDFIETRTLETSGHEFGEWEDVVNTCTEHVQNRECENCDFIETRTLEPDGHDFGDWEDIVDTCTERVQRRVCTKCGTARTREWLPKGHNYGEWEDYLITCTYRIYVRTCVDCIHREIQYEAIPDGHEFGEWEDVINTCTEHVQSRTCANCDFTQTRDLEPRGHVFVGDRCVECDALGYNGEALDWLDKYNGDYGYNYFRNNRFSAEQMFYKRLDEQVRIFHVNGNINARNVGNNTYVAATIDFSDLGISDARAVSVWKTFKDDNPLYYWISSMVRVEDQSRLLLICSPEYAEGATRQRYNELVYSKVDEYANLSAAGDGAYSKALAFHDKIIQTIDYAYDENNNPSSQASAHNILGVFEESGGVCEAYTRAFQLLLNYTGVENLFVSGTATGGGHSWNLVRLDDGGWYWCDLTWDDTPDIEWGISYNYFLVNDEQNVNWYDDGIADEKVVFLDEHTPETPEGNGVNFLYSLPARAENEYREESGVTVRSTFTADEATYAVAGYKTAQYVYTEQTGDVVVPETVEYNGITYTVISVGRISDKIFQNGVVFFGDEETRVFISATVKYIWDGALGLNISDITVSGDNRNYSSDDGVLYTKDREFLVQYPPLKRGTEYTIVDECTGVVHGAFYAVQYLQKLHIGSLVDDFNYRLNNKSSYNNSPYLDGGDLQDIFNSLHGEAEITVDEQNQNLTVIDNAIYSVVGENLTLFCVTDKDITEFEILANVTYIANNIFWGFENLERFILADGNSTFAVRDGILYNADMTKFAVIPVGVTGPVTLPESITAIGGMDGGFIGGEVFYGAKIVEITLGTQINCLGNAAFDYCQNLTTINYTGTVAQWRAIQKHENWCTGTGHIRIVCSNGILDKDGNVIAPN